MNVALPLWNPVLLREVATTLSQPPSSLLPRLLFPVLGWGKRACNLIVFHAEPPDSGDCLKGSKQAANNEINNMFLHPTHYVSLSMHGVCMQHVQQFKL